MGGKKSNHCPFRFIGLSGRFSSRTEGESWRLSIVAPPLAQPLDRLAHGLAGGGTGHRNHRCRRGHHVRVGDAALGTPGGFRDLGHQLARGYLLASNASSAGPRRTASATTHHPSSGGHTAGTGGQTAGRGTRSARRSPVARLCASTARQSYQALLDLQQDIGECGVGCAVAGDADGPDEHVRLCGARDVHPCRHLESGGAHAYRRPGGTVEVVPARLVGRVLRPDRRSRRAGGRDADDQPNLCRWMSDPPSGRPTVVPNSSVSPAGSH